MPDPIDLIIVVFALVITVVSFLFGFVARGLAMERMRLQGVFFLCLAFCGILTFNLWREVRAPATLSRHIMPYAGVDRSTYVPLLPRGRGRAWLFDSADPPDRIYAFYREERHRAGWTLTDGAPMVLRRDGVRLVLFATGDRAGSTILYVVSGDRR